MLRRRRHRRAGLRSARPADEVGRDDRRADASPTRIDWCDGCEAEYDRLCDGDGARGHLQPARIPPSAPTASSRCSDPTDVARVEDRTFICSEHEGRRRPDQQLGRRRRRCAQTLRRLFDGCMRGRTMYVIPFRMGPLGSPIAHIGVEITDSPLRRRQHAHHDPHGPRGARRRSATTATSCPACTRSARRSRPAQKDVPGPATRTRSTSSTSPKTREIWSYGRGYGGNALLGKKCFALRIASVMARDEGWLAEHMLILGVESPRGREDATSRRPSRAPAARPTSRC